MGFEKKSTLHSVCVKISYSDQNCFFLCLHMCNDKNNWNGVYLVPGALASSKHSMNSNSEQSCIGFI